MSSEVFEPDAIDFYDWDALDKLRKKRSEKEMKLMKLVIKGDRDAKRRLIKHKEEDEIIKEKSQQTGYYWY